MINNILRNIKRLLTFSPSATYSQYKELKQTIAANKDVQAYFFFPYCHIGGAEKVHANIIEVFEKQKILVFFTGVSHKSDFLYMFKKHAPSVNIGYGINYPFLRRKATKLIFDSIHSQKAPIAFGCNNLFFYESVLKFEKKVRVFDLYHDFRFEGETNLNHSFAKQFFRCEKRVFISNLALQQTKLFYKAIQAEQKEYDKLTLITNYTYIPEKLIEKDFNATLNILYVGRGTSEKRAHIVGLLAKKCHENRVMANFTAIGELEQVIPSDCKQHVNYTGPITDFEKLKIHYQNNHIILITSDKEGFPLTIMEGMAHGCVSISTPVGDVPLHTKDCGFVTSNIIETDVINEMFEQIKMLDNDRKQLTNLSHASFNYANKHFSKERFFEEYKNLLKI